VERLLTVHEVAEMLGVPVQTIYQWRQKSYGPRGVRVGKHLRYPRAEVDRFINAQLDSRAAATP